MRVEATSAELGNAGWSDHDRDAAYTALCRAVTRAGEARETLFLARLTLLLAERLGDPDAFARALDQAALPDPDDADARA